MVNEMMKTSRIAIVIILASIVAMVAPASAAMYGGGQSVSDRAEKYVEIADRAGDRVGDLIDLVSLNTTPIEDAGLIDEFNLNVSLFGTGLEHLENASISLVAEDYESAVGNATEALSIFKEVLRSIHYIMQESGIARGDIIEAQGLLTAMDRALERIDRLRELLENIDDEEFAEEIEEAIALLDEAETYLNKDTAILWLLDGNVTDTAHNLTQANHLISEAHKIIKDLAKESNSWRLGNYLAKMVRARERVRERCQYAGGEGVDVNAVLNQLGYQNMTEFIQTLQNMAADARGADNFKDALQELREIGQTIREMDQALTQTMNQHQNQHGQGGTGGEGGSGQGGNGSGNGQNGGSGQGNGGSP